MLQSYAREQSPNKGIVAERTCTLLVIAGSPLTLHAKAPRGLRIPNGSDPLFCALGLSGLQHHGIVRGKPVAFVYENQPPDLMHPELNEAPSC